MPQLQSLHLHVQALVLTEPDLDSPTYQSGPLCFASHAQWSLPPNPHLELEVLPLSPGSPILTLSFPEHLTLPANILLDLRPRASGWHGMALSFCALGLLGIYNPDDKLWRLSYWSPHSSISVQGPGLVLALWDKKPPDY